MKELRWHGRGGQGAVTSAELLAKAAIGSGLYAQAFPLFGPERRGAPVLAFNRIDNSPIELNSQVYEPDIVVVLDATLLRTVHVNEGLKQGGVLILNTTRGPDSFANEFDDSHIATVDATGIALKRLGSNIVSTAMLGALAKATGILELGSIAKVVSEQFGAGNLEAVRETYSATLVAG